MTEIMKMNAKERRKEQRAQRAANAAAQAAEKSAKRRRAVPRFISNLKGDAMTPDALGECLCIGQLENVFLAQVVHISTTGNIFARFGNEEAHATERGMLRSSRSLARGEYIVVQVDRNARRITETHRRALKLTVDWDLTAELSVKAVLISKPSKPAKKSSPAPSHEKCNLFAMLESESDTDESEEDESEDEQDLAAVERGADEQNQMEAEERATRLTASVVLALGAAAAAASVAEAAVQHATETSAACTKEAAAREAVVATKPTLVRLSSQKRQVLANLEGNERKGWGDYDSECDSPFVDSWEAMASPVGTPM
jgi:hypothetical protein